MSAAGVDETVQEAAFKGWLGDDPYAFVAYQTFAQRLLRYVSQSWGANTSKDWQARHAKVVRYREPLTKLIDELAFSRRLARRLVVTLGG